MSMGSRRELRPRLGSPPLFAVVAAVIAAISPAADAGNAIGAWSAPTDSRWPLNPIHAALLPDGRVITYGTNADGKQTGRFIYDVWDPRLGLGGGHYTLPNTTVTDLFCSAQIILPQSGNVFLVGGDNWVPATNSTNNVGNNNTLTFTTVGGPHLIQGPNMSRARWYATTTMLPNGEVYIQGGREGADRPEVRGVDGTLRLLPGANTTGLFWYYPRNWVAPDGRIFGFSDRAMYYVDPRGAGSVTRAGDLPVGGPAGVTSSAVMYRPGQIFSAGGGAGVLTANNTTTVGTNAAVTININSGAPRVTQLAPMPLALQWHTATVTADGTVVVTGGAIRSNVLQGVSNRALIWTPTKNADSGRWNLGATTSSGKARLYHSTALLLPDASVLVGGGGSPGPQINTNAEIYYPPYLFTAAGGFATRPLLLRAPAQILAGSRFSVRVNRPGSIKRITLVRNGSVTHSFNMEQRFMDLGFSRSGNGDLSVRAPASLTVAPPGYYLLFAIDAAGVPSIARTVLLNGTAG